MFTQNITSTKMSLFTENHVEKNRRCCDSITCCTIATMDYGTDPISSFGLGEVYWYTRNKFLIYFHNSLNPKGTYFLLPLESKQEATSGWNFTKYISEVKVNQLKVKNTHVRWAHPPLIVHIFLWLSSRWCTRCDLPITKATNQLEAAEGLHISATVLLHTLWAVQAVCNQLCPYLLTKCQSSN